MPHFLRPCVIFRGLEKNADVGFRLASKLFSNVPKRTRQALKHLTPLFAAHRKQREESDVNDERPVCLVLGKYK